MRYDKLFKVLTPEEFKIYVYFYEKYGNSFKKVSQGFLGNELSISRRKVISCIQSLISLELMEQDTTVNGKENLYRVLPPTEDLSGKFYVYVLYLNGEVIYIGSSQELDRRLVSHKSDKVFDSVKYCILPDKRAMLTVENYGIAKLKPRLNKRVPTNEHKLPFTLEWLEYDLQ